MTTEEVKQQTEQQQQEEQKSTEQVEKKEPSGIELKAMEMGWRPKEEFSGDEDDFIDAKEFVRRQPLFDKIEGTTKELKNLKKAMEALKQHYTAKEEAAVKTALARLEEARTEAVTNADGETFAKVDKEIKRVEQQAAALRQMNEHVQQVDPELQSTFVSWINKNPWYKDEEAMRVYADKVGTRLHQQGADPFQVLQEVEKAVKREFPHKFKNPNKENAPDVDSSSRGSNKSQKDSVELTDQERKVMNMLVSTKQMTKEEYLADIKKMRAASK